jgi:hypothetical protein
MTSVVPPNPGCPTSRRLCEKWALARTDFSDQGRPCYPLVNKLGNTFRKPLGIRAQDRSAHLEEDGRVLLHRHFLIDDKGHERMMIELRMTRR